jgi:hypothetical protein
MVAAVTIIWSSRHCPFVVAADASAPIEGFCSIVNQKIPTDANKKAKI